MFLYLRKQICIINVNIPFCALGVKRVAFPEYEHPENWKFHHSGMRQQQTFHHYEHFNRSALFVVCCCKIGYMYKFINLCGFAVVILICSKNTYPKLIKKIYFVSLSISVSVRSSCIQFSFP